MAGLGGAGLASALWLAVAGTAPQVDARYWLITEPPVPVEVAEHAGELRPDPAALDLWGYRAAAPVALAWSEGVITLDARIPDGAELGIRLGGRLADSAPIAPNQNAPSLAAAGGGGVEIRFDRLRGRTVVTGLGRCVTAGDVGPTPHMALTVDPDAVSLIADGRPFFRCARGPFEVGPPVFTSGLRRVQISGLSFAPTGLPTWTTSFGGPLRGPIGALLAALAGAALGALRGSAWMVVPGAMALLAMLPRWRATLDALRLLAVPEELVPLLLGGVPFVVGLVLTYARLSPGRAIGAGLAPALLLSPLLLRFPDARGWCILALTALPLALASHGSARRWNPLVLVAFSAAAFALVELGLRHTRLAEDWSRTAGFARAQEELHALLEAKTYSAYPTSGFPVRPPPQSTLPRIVAFGGSSTGGAFAMDDLSLFWPRRVEERLSGWEVVNQGVGGWHTGHIRLYAEQQMSALSPEIVVLYVGHNDAMSKSTVPFSAHVKRYREAGRSSLTNPFDSLRVYHGLKYTLLSLRDPSSAVAVPLREAEDNLRAIIGMARDAGAKTLLVAEAVNPDPAPLDDYATMMKEVAAETGARHLDGRRAMFERDQPRDFIDDCHLTVTGHQALGAIVAADLVAAGWVGAAAPTAPPAPGG